MSDVELFCGTCGRTHTFTRQPASRPPWKETYRCPTIGIEFEAVFGRVRARTSRADKESGKRRVNLRAYHGAQEELHEFEMPKDSEMEARSGDEFALILVGDRVQAWQNLTVRRGQYFGMTGIGALARGAVALLFVAIVIYAMWTSTHEIITRAR